MMIPIRCWGCGKPVGHLWEQFQEKLEKGEDRKKVLDLASKNKLKISKKLNNYIQDYWTNYEPEKDVA